MYSLRDLLSYMPNIGIAKQMLSTSTVGMLLPGFEKEYGENKNIDIVGTLSHEYIQDQITNLVNSGMYLDKNGNIKFVISAGA